MTNITKAFQKARAESNGALIGYIMAGDPTPKATPKIADALIKGGVDILELGLPFSDPIADGPTIQAAGLRALNAGTTPMKVLEIAGQIKQQHDVPIVVMTYYNPVFRIGLDKFMGEAKECKVDGFIIPDLPVEEAADYKKAAKSCGLNTIFLGSTLDIKRAINQNRRRFLRIPLPCFPLRRHRHQNHRRRLNSTAYQANKTIYRWQGSVGCRLWDFHAKACQTDR